MKRGTEYEKVIQPHLHVSLWGHLDFFREAGKEFSLNGEKFMEKMLRLKDVLKIVPVGKSSFWAGIKTGRYPAGRKLSERTTVWMESDIEKLVNKVAGV